VGADVNNARLTEIDIRDGVAPPTTTVPAAPTGTGLDGVGMVDTPGTGEADIDPGALLEAGPAGTEAGGTEAGRETGGLERCAVEACPVVQAAVRIATSTSRVAGTRTPATRRPAVCVLAALRWRDI